MNLLDWSNQTSPSGRRGSVRFAQRSSYPLVALAVQARTRGARGRIGLSMEGSRAMPRVAKRPLTVVLLVVSIMAASVTPALAGSAGGGNVDISGTAASRSLLPGQCIILGIDGSNDI